MPWLSLAHHRPIWVPFGVLLSLERRTKPWGPWGPLEQRIVLLSEPLVPLVQHNCFLYPMFDRRLRLP